MILLYHSTPVHVQDITQVQCGDFQGQMEWVAPRKSRNGPSWGITFDDGYEDNFTVAYPILHDLGLTATIFLTTDYLGRTSTFNADLRLPMLTWEQIREMSAAGFEFGSHGCSHRPLGKLSREEVERELRASKEVIEDHLGREVTSLAYPHGSFNAETKELAAQAGYRMAFAVHPLPGIPTDDFCRPRVMINGNDGLWRFRWKLTALGGLARRAKECAATLKWRASLGGGRNSEFI